MGSKTVSAGFGFPDRKVLWQNKSASVLNLQKKHFHRYKALRSDGKYNVEFVYSDMSGAFREMDRQRIEILLK